MDPNELIKAAPEIAKGAGALAATIPFTGIVKRMLGPAADELAEMWRDQIRLYRYERQLKCVEKAEKMTEEAGFTPQAVPPKILFPLLEGVSFEENEELHTMWAALLANAASVGTAEVVRPGFIAILKQMAPDEAALLKWIYERTWSPEGRYDFPEVVLFATYGTMGFLSPDPVNPVDSREVLTNNLRFGACMDSLEAGQLVRSQSEETGRIYKMTTRGDQFMRACRPPKPE